MNEVFALLTEAGSSQSRQGCFERRRRCDLSHRGFPAIGFDSRYTIMSDMQNPVSSDLAIRN